MNNALYLLNEKNKEVQKRSVLGKQKAKNLNAKQRYTNAIDVPTTYAIYIQSIQKVIELLKDSIVLTKQINDESSNEGKEVDARASIISNIDKIDLILAEFIKLFSVVNDVNLKETYHHLFMKFYGIDIQVKLFFIKHDIKYAENSIKICKYLCKIFGILEQHTRKEHGIKNTTASSTKKSSQGRYTKTS